MRRVKLRLRNALPIGTTTDSLIFRLSETADLFGDSEHGDLLRKAARTIVELRFKTAPRTVAGSPVST